MFPLAPRRSARIAARATAAKKAVAAAAPPPAEPAPLRRSARLAVKEATRSNKELDEVVDFIRTALKTAYSEDQPISRTEQVTKCLTFIKAILTKYRRDKTFKKHFHSLGDKFMDTFRSKCQTFIKQITEEPTPNRILNADLIISSSKMLCILEGRTVWW
jgi:hypothetical protein